MLAPALLSVCSSHGMPVMQAQASMCQQLQFERSSPSLCFSLCPLPPSLLSLSRSLARSLARSLNLSIALSLALSLLTLSYSLSLCTPSHSRARACLCALSPSLPSSLPSSLAPLFNASIRYRAVQLLSNYSFRLLF